MVRQVSSPPSRSRRLVSALYSLMRHGSQETPSWNWGDLNADIFGPLTDESLVFDRQIKYHQVYVTIWLEIKKEWGLSMDPEEARVMKSMLEV